MLLRVGIVGAVLAMLGSSWLTVARPTVTGLAGTASSQSPPPLPAPVSNIEFQQLMNGLSERGGSFHSDNFVSNETMLSEAIALLEDRPHASGAYIGVGPEQNFSYIVTLRPEIAFILDIRRDNLIQHLLYKALAELSEDRGEFLSRLFSRPRPPPAPYDDELPVMLKMLGAVKPSKELFAANLTEVAELLTVRRGLSLTEQDHRRLKSIYEHFRNDGPEITYQGKSPAWPTFAEMVTDTDGGGVSRTFLSTEERFQRFKAYQERNLIVPVVGDFGGKTALRAIGSAIRARGLIVRAFYLSNVEQYLFRGALSTGNWQEFYRNVDTLPRDAGTVFIRSIPPTRMTNPAPMSTPLRAEAKISVSPIDLTLRAFHDKSLDSYLKLGEISGAGLTGTEADVLRLFRSYARGTTSALIPDEPWEFVGLFKRVAKEWIESATGAERLTREHTAALAVLEIARNAIESSEGQWRDYKGLIEWACDRLRYRPASEFERDWMLAAAALGARAGDASFIADHRGSCKAKQPCNQARHGLWRFPEDRRFEVAALMSYPALRVASNRPGVAYDVLLGKPVDTNDERRQAREDLLKLLDDLDRLAADSLAGSEAQLRAGVLRYHLHSLPRALVDFRAVASSASDRDLVYLARLFSGLTYSALQRPDSAVREFRAALQVLPGARAAATVLASHLVQTDAHDEGLALMDSMFIARDVDDPWYRFADLRWPAAIKRMREALRQ